MKHWIALLVSFVLTASAVVTNAVINPADKVRAGAGNGVSEEIKDAEEFAELFASLPTVAEYYNKYAPKGEGEGESEEEDLISEAFKPLTLDTTSNYEYSTKSEGSKYYTYVYDVTDKNKLPPNETDKISKQYEETVPTYETGYYKLDRKMSIHYFADGVMLSCDAVLTTGSIKYENTKVYNEIGHGTPTYVIGYDEKPIYEKDENGQDICDEEHIKTPVPDETSPVDNLGKRRAYNYEYATIPRQIAQIYKNTYTLVVQTVKASLFISQGRVFEKFDEYDIEYECYEEKKETAINEDLPEGRGRGPEVVTVTELEHPDKDSRENKIRDEMIEVINKDFKGVWFSLSVEPREYKDLPDMSNMTQEQAAMAYAKLSDKQKEELNKMSILAMFGSQMDDLSKGLAKNMIDIADKTAESYAFFGSYLASVAARNAADSSGKKYISYSTTYYQGKPRGKEEYLDFALAFLDERNFYKRETYENERAAEKEQAEKYYEWLEEHPEVKGTPEEENNPYRESRRKRVNGTVSYDNPFGEFTINLVSPTAPKLSYEISGGIARTKESASVHYEGEENEYTVYSYDTISKDSFKVKESVTIRNVGNVKVVAPDKVDTDFFDVIYPVLLGEFQPDSKEG